ncbi:c-type cytochrome [Verrucomicrobiaceae bacterium R5-34]|nr:c-type cytochrome [Verrucomicrobiaceae bacterium R5-34]
MSTQSYNHRDTPLRRFSTFWLGLAVFGLFGLLSAIVVCWSGSSTGVEQVLKEQRLDVKETVAENQATMLERKVLEEGKTEQVPPSEVFDDISADLKKAPVSSGEAKPMTKAPGGDIAKGKELWQSKNCFTCHGADANTPLTPNYPKLAGQDSVYLLAQMKAFHDGSRKSGQSAVMTATLMGANLSDDETNNIVAWLASLDTPDVKHADDAGKQLFTAKLCASCHGADADKPLQPGYAKLKGQNPQYLIDQLKAFKSGARTNGQAATMTAIMANVSEEEIKVLAEWIAGSK